MNLSWLGIPLAALISWLVCARLVRARGRFMDHPNERSLHEVPVPKGGGLGILAGLVVALVLLVPMPRELAWMVVLALALGGISLLDDLYHLSSLARFLMQSLLAGLLILQVGVPKTLPLPGGTGWPIEIGIVFGWLFVVWMTNLYNFMDGMDGFAGGMAMFGFSTLALLGWLGGDERFALLSAAVAAASAAFLRFNFPPAQLFMGDVGSASLGFLASGLLLAGYQRDLFPLWVGGLIFLPFIFDATVTLIRRLLRRERVWQAHRGHYYQRLVQWGWGHRRTVLWEYGLMLLCAVAALWAVRLPLARQWMLLGAVLSIFVFVMIWVEFIERREKAGRGH